jgi:hypothetical protein
MAKVIEVSLVTDILSVVLPSGDWSEPAPFGSWAAAVAAASKSVAAVNNKQRIYNKVWGIYRFVFNKKGCPILFEQPF